MKVLKETFQAIQFLDGLSFGILQRCIAPTVLKTGGNLVHLGLFLSIMPIFRVISNDFFTELLAVSTKRKCLKISLVACTILNGLLLANSTFPAIIYNRIAYVIFYRVSILSGELSTLNEKEKIDPQTFGLIIAFIASIFVGAIFDEKYGFEALVILSTLLSGANLFVLSKAATDKTDAKIVLKLGDVPTLIPKTATKIFWRLRGVKIDFKRLNSNTNILLVKFLLVLHMQVLSIFCVVLIIVYFDGRAKLVNFIGAYQVFVMYFSGKYFVNLRKKLEESLSLGVILEKSCLVCTLCSLSLGFSPTIIFYTMMFVPFFISRMFFQHYFDKLYDVRKTPEILEQTRMITFVSEIFSPVIVGICLQFFSYHAFRFFIFAPVLTCFYIVKNYPPSGAEKKRKDVGKSE